MAKNNGLPNVVFVGNAKKRVKHVLCLFEILDTHDDGSPRTVRRLRDDKSVNVKEGMAFMTAYVQHQMIERG